MGELDSRKDMFIEPIHDPDPYYARYVQIYNFKAIEGKAYCVEKNNLGYRGTESVIECDRQTQHLGIGVQAEGAEINPLSNNYVEHATMEALKSEFLDTFYLRNHRRNEIVCFRAKTSGLVRIIVASKKTERPIRYRLVIFEERAQTEQ